MFLRGRNKASCR